MPDPTVGPTGVRATWLRRQADAMTDEAEDLREEAAAADEAWTEIRACQADRRQMGLVYE